MWKIKSHVVLLSCLFFLAAGLATAVASDSNLNMEQRVLKIEKALGLSQNTGSGMTLEERVNAIEKQLNAAPAAAGTPQGMMMDAGGAIGRISEKITLSGAIELDYSYADDSDTGDNTKNDSTSELDVGTIELGLEAALHPYVTANVLLKGENLDSDSDRVFWDEVFFTIARDDMPFYFVGGKRCQPFGLFESLFINDPITQDLYEINDTGATVGYANEDFFGIDVSATIYKGASLINRVKETEYGWERSNSAGFTDTNDVNSYILSAALSPVDGLVLAAYYNSEPGDTDRNTTLGGSVHWEIFDFIMDLEYIGALDRERHVADNREYNESAWFASLGYQVSDSLVVAVRYEDFDADRSASGNLDYRYGVAATYTLFESDGFACNLMGEVRRSEYEYISGGTTDQELNELFTRLALEF